MQKSLLLVLFILGSLLSKSQPMKSKTKILLLMGSRFEITAVDSSEVLIDKSIEAAILEVRRIENLISEWVAGTEVDLINKNSGIKAVKVDIELYNLIERCKKVSVLTDGAFDISWAAASKLWHFDSTMTKVPSQDQINNILPLIGFEKIILNKSDTSVFLTQKGMKIGFGAIGKGYAANKARDKMKSLGIKSGIVIAGGDLITWGTMSTGKNWTIGIADPKNPRNAIAWLEVGEMGVVTSGDYEKFVYIDGKKYSHIINPKTGYPVSGLISVTVISPDAELCDALATAVSVLGPDKGLGLINQMRGVECVMITDTYDVLTSKGVTLNYYKKDEKNREHQITIGQKKR